MNASLPTTGMVPVVDAVQNYVDALLQDVPTADATSSSTATEPHATANLHRYRVCRIASVRLALPVDGLLEPITLPPLLTYASSDGALGRHRHGGREWRVVDLAEITAPGIPRPLPDMLLPLAVGHWALACSLEPDLLEVDPESIRWRDAGGQRPWLVGMTAENTCAIVDLAALTAELESNPRFNDEAEQS